MDAGVIFMAFISAAEQGYFDLLHRVKIGVVNLPFICPFR